VREKMEAKTIATLLKEFSIFFALMLITSIASGTPLDTIVVPAFGPHDTGSSAFSSVVLEKDCEYKIVITGVFQFKVGTDWGYADAQYRMGAGHKYTQRFNSIEFDGARVDADVSDVENHTYTFYRIGRGKNLRFSIFDCYTTGERGGYDDNAGSLKIEIYAIASLSLTKSASPHAIEQGKTTTITLTVKNTGTTEIRDVEISDAISPGFTLISGKLHKKYDSLKPKDTRAFQYVIQSSESGTFNLGEANASYYDERGNYRISKSNIATITVIPSVEPTPTKISTASVQLHGEKTDVVVGEDILLRLSAVNLITKPIMHVQVIIIPPSGMSVTSAEFVQSGAGQFTTTYELDPGKGRDIEVRIKSNQVGDFEVEGRAIYYFGDDTESVEDHTLTLPIKVRPPGITPTPSTSDGGGIFGLPGFEAMYAIAGLLIAVFLIRRMKNQKVFKP
jgi:uncharacterized repeat protein (TIGR01451 family)